MPELAVYTRSENIEPKIEREIRALLDSEWLGSSQDPVSGALIDRDLHPVYFVFTEGDRVLGYARTICVWVAHLGRTFKLYGLGDVITAPQWRRMGYGTRLVEAASAYIRSDPEADAALLLTEPRLEALYGRSGWTHVSGLRVVTDDREETAAEVFPMMMFLSAGARAVSGDFAQRPLVLPGEEW